MHDKLLRKRGTGPTSVAEQLVRLWLSQLREDAGLSREEAAAGIGAAGHRVWRLETGRAQPTRQTVLALLDLYGASEADRAEVLEHLRVAGQRPWWHEYHDVLPDHMLGRLHLEAAATLIRTYSLGAMPELLMTPDYAEYAFARQWPSDDRATLRRRVELHVRRVEAVLHRVQQQPAKVWAVLEESVLHHRTVPASVLRGQLDYLESFRLRRHLGVTVQVIPLNAPQHPARVIGELQLIRCTPAAYVQRPKVVLPETVITRTLGGIRVTDDSVDAKLALRYLHAAALAARRIQAPLPAVDTDY